MALAFVATPIYAVRTRKAQHLIRLQVNAAQHPVPGIFSHYGPAVDAGYLNLAPYNAQTFVTAAQAVNMPQALWHQKMIEAQNYITCQGSRGSSVLHLGLDLGVRVRRVLRELDHDGVLVHDRDVAGRHEVGLAGLDDLDVVRVVLELDAHGAGLEVAEVGYRAPHDWALARLREHRADRLDPVEAPVQTNGDGQARCRRESGGSHVDGVNLLNDCDGRTSDAGERAWG